MVKVLAVDLFQSGGILPIGAEPGSEPVAVASTNDFVIVASRNGLITFYDADGSKVRSCFRSRGVVTGLWFSEVTGALFTVEATNDGDTKEDDYVFPRNAESVMQWKVRSGPSTSSPVVATLQIGERFVVTHHEGPWVRVRLHRDDGDLVGWTRTTVRETRYLHKATRQRPRAMPRLYYNWDRGTVDCPAQSQVVRQVERIGLMSTGKKQYSTVFEDNLDQDTTVSVLLMEHTDNEVQKLSVCPSTGNVAVCSRAKIAVHHVELVNEFPVVTELFSLRPKCSVVDIALCQEFIGYTSSTEAYALRIQLTANEEAPPSGPDPDVAAGEAGEAGELAVDDMVAWGEDPKMVAFEFESSGEASSGSSLYSVPVSFKSHPSADAGVQHKEILGPLSVADQGVHGASECGYWVSSCDCYLYTSVRDSGLSIHTLTLLPAHTERLADMCNGVPADRVANRSSPLLPTDTGVIGGVCCFVSHELQGYMYGFARGATRLLSSYSYMQPSNSAAISDYLLFITTAGDIGHVETYTIRNVLDADETDSAIENLDVTFFGSKNIFSPTEVKVGDRNVVILVKHTEAKTDTLKRGKDAHLSNFNVYALRTCGLGDLFNMIVAVGEEYRSNWPYYYQVLLEAHQLLRAEVGALAQTRFSKDERVLAENRENLRKYTQLLRDSCVLLGDHLLEKRDLEWQSLVLYFTASHLPLSAVLDKLTTRQPALKAASEGSAPLTGEDEQAAACIVAILKRYLFEDTYRRCVDDTPELANMILRLFWHVDFEHLPQLILRSHIGQYDATAAVALLKTSPPVSPASGAAAAPPGHSDESKVALCILSLRLGDVQLATQYVTGLDSFVRKVCIAIPSLLYTADLDDFTEDKAVPEGWAGSTAFAGLLGRLDIELLVGCFIGLHGKVPIKTAIACLIQCDQTDSFAGPVNYLQMTLAATSQAPLDSESTLCCIDMLVHLQLQLFHRRLGRQTPSDTASCHGNGETPKGSDGADVATWLAVMVALDQTLAGPARAALRGVQATLSAYVTPANAAALYAGVQRSGGGMARRHPGYASLELLCLPAMERFKDGQVMVLELCPEALVGYCRAFIKEQSHAVEDWGRIHKTMLAHFQSKPMPDWVPYRDFLRYIAEAVDPEALLGLIPDEGNMEFYTPIIEHCYRHTQARLLTENITEKVGILS